MEIASDARALLSQLGLNDYEIRAYMALLYGKRLTASKISTVSAIPSSRVYDILDSLAKKGFVLIGLEKPIKYKAVAPKEALSQYKQRLQIKCQEELAEFDRKIKTVISALHPFQKNFRLTKPRDMFSIRENEDILIMLQNTIDGAKSSIDCVIDREVSTMLIKNYKNLLKTKKMKDVSIKFITTNNSLIKDLSKIGEVKTTSSPANSFFLKDKDDLLLMRKINNLKEVRGTAIWTNSKLICDTFLWIFENLWQSSSNP